MLVIHRISNVFNASFYILPPNSNHQNLRTAAWGRVGCETEPCGSMMVPSAAPLTPAHVVVEYVAEHDGAVGDEDIIIDLPHGVEGSDQVFLRGRATRRKRTVQTCIPKTRLKGDRYTGE